MATVRAILLEPIRKLGTTGDIVNVKRGFFRYLLGLKRITYATKPALEALELNLAKLKEQDEERRVQAETWASALANQKLVLYSESGERGMLYGSVAARDIAQSLKAFNIHIHPNQVALPKPIKEVGSYTVRLDLHPQVTTEVSFSVVSPTVTP
jgi:large subunit ribosomal protein L9